MGGPTQQTNTFVTPMVVAPFGQVWIKIWKTVVKYALIGAICVCKIQDRVSSNVYLK